MLLFVHNETRPFFYQGFQRLGHKEIEKAYQIISIMNRNQVFSQTGETELIDIFISFLLSKTGYLYLLRIFCHQFSNRQFRLQGTIDLKLRSYYHTGSNFHNHSVFIINLRFYLFMISSECEVETCHVMLVRLYVF